MSDPIQPVGPPAVASDNPNTTTDAHVAVAGHEAPPPVGNVEPTLQSSASIAPAAALESGNGPVDPLNIGRHRRDDVTLKQLQIDHPKANKRQLREFYRNQNKLINHYLGVDDEERLQVEEDARLGPKIKFAINASFTVNFCLFVIQLYAAVSTGSLSVGSPMLNALACAFDDVSSLANALGSSSPRPPMPLWTWSRPA